MEQFKAKIFLLFKQKRALSLVFSFLMFVIVVLGLLMTTKFLGEYTGKAIFDIDKSKDCRAILNNETFNLQGFLSSESKVSSEVCQQLFDYNEKEVLDKLCSDTSGSGTLKIIWNSQVIYSKSMYCSTN